jgi:hypothetical protein
LLALLAALEPRPTARVLRLPGLTQDGDDVEQWLQSLPDSWEPERCQAELERLAAEAPMVGTDASGTPGPARDDDDTTPLEVSSPWPEPPDPVVYQGLAGDFVRAIEPETEADPVGLLVQLLAGVGSVIGRSAYYLVEATKHHTNENVVLVGETALRRKGTGWGRVRALLAAVDPDWARKRITGGLSSGEGLITQVRDETWQQQPIKDKGRIVGYENVMTDAGESDKRLLVVESEFGGVLRVLERDGNRLSPLLRQAWDSGALATLTKSPYRATDAHISIIGHITAEELRALLSRIDTQNGFANRFLWVCVRRSKVLPHGGRDVDLAPLVHRLAGALEQARSMAQRSPRARLSRTAAALWESR